VRSSASIEITSESIHVRARTGWTLRWSDIDRIEAFKADLLTADDVCLAFIAGAMTYTVDEETPGWQQLGEAIRARFAVHPNWFATVVQPPFAMNRTILWDRAAATAMQRLAPLESWTRARADFEPDGSLRDVVLRNTSIEDWNTAIAVARGVTGDVIVAHDLTVRHFTDGSRAQVTMRIGEVELVGHCFAAEEIELSLNPADVDSADRFAALVRFLVALAAVLQRPVHLTPENLAAEPILVIAPDGVVTYVAPRFK
jgi:hypothetical protein